MTEKRGRKPNESDTVPIRVSLPEKLHSYLQYLARNSFIGANVSDVAAYMITQQALSMTKDKFHELELPSDDSAA